MLIPLSSFVATALAIASVVVPCFLAVLTGFMVNQQRLSLTGTVACVVGWAVSLIASISYGLVLSVYMVAPAGFLALLLVVGVIVGIVLVALASIWMLTELYEAMQRGRFSALRH